MLSTVNISKVRSVCVSTCRVVGKINTQNGSGVVGLSRDFMGWEARADFS